MSDVPRTRQLPERPSVRFLKVEAKRRHVAGEFERLHQVQHALAREHGFASWPRLVAHIELLGKSMEERADALVRSACSSDPRVAVALLEAEPSLASATLATELCTGRPLDRAAIDPDEPVGPLGWPSLLYTTFTRLLRLAPERAPGIREAARTLLSLGANPSIVVEVSPGAPGSDVGERLTPLYGAAGVNNDVGLTRLLLDAGADVDEGEGPADAADPKSGWGTESLYHACEFSDVGCLLALLDAKPDPVRVSYCLGRAIDFADPTLAIAFLEHGADPGFRVPWAANRTHLHKAAAQGRTAVVEACLQRGADPNALDDNGVSPLALAVRAGRTDIAELLAGAGADVSTVTAQDRLLGDSGLGGDFLFRAARTGDVSPVVAALAAGLDVNDPSVGGGAPLLHTAASVGQRAVVRVLLDAGADPNIVSSFGSNALGATMWGSRNMFDLEGGPAARPLTEIPQEGFVAVARLLLAAGADVPKTLASDEVQAVIDQR